MTGTHPKPDPYEHELGTIWRSPDGSYWRLLPHGFDDDYGLLERHWAKADSATRAEFDSDEAADDYGRWRRATFTRNLDCTASDIADGKLDDQLSLSRDIRASKHEVLLSPFDTTIGRYTIAPWGEVIVQRDPDLGGRGMSSPFTPVGLWLLLGAVAALVALGVGIAYLDAVVGLALLAILVPVPLALSVLTAAQLSPLTRHGRAHRAARAMGRDWDLAVVARREAARRERTFRAAREGTE